MLIYPNALIQLEENPKYKPYLQMVQSLAPYLTPMRFGIKRHANMAERLQVVRPVNVFWVGTKETGKLYIGWRKQGSPGYYWGSEVREHTCSAPVEQLRRITTMKRVPIWVNTEPLP